MADILVFAPHPDDAELAMGGAIARWAAEGLEVAVVDVTTGEPTPFGNEQIRAGETDAASRALGIKIRENLGLPNRWVELTLENRHIFAAAIRRHRPKVLFIPFHLDAHPDHLAVHDLALRARFDAKLSKTDIPGEPYYVHRIVQYYCTHLRVDIQPSFLVDVSAYIEPKKRAMEAYQSQFYTGRENPGEVPKMVMDTLSYFGTRIRCAAAEPFYVDEPLRVEDPLTLS